MFYPEKNVSNIMRNNSSLTKSKLSKTNIIHNFICSIGKFVFRWKEVHKYLCWTQQHLPSRTTNTTFKSTYAVYLIFMSSMGNGWKHLTEDKKNLNINCGNGDKNRPYFTQLLNWQQSRVHVIFSHYVSKNRWNG